MMLTTYALEFQPPAAERSGGDSIRYYVNRFGRRHYDLLKNGLPILKKLETEQDKNDDEPIDDDDDAEKLLREKEQFSQLLFRTEWTGIGPMGRMLRPAVIPANITPEEERGLWRMYDDTRFCSFEDDQATILEQQEEETQDYDNQQTSKYAYEYNDEDIVVKPQKNYQPLKKKECIVFC